MPNNNGLAGPQLRPRLPGAGLTVIGRLGVILLLTTAGFGVAQEGSPREIGKMLEQARQGPEKETLELLTKSLELADQAPLTPAERRALAKQFIKTVQKAFQDGLLSMDKLEKVLAAKGKKHVARQISYHRYVEQWHVVHPLPFRVLWDCPKGQDPTLRIIQVAP